MNEIIQGNCLDVLSTLLDQSVNCCVTSPPYFGLRDYGMVDQLGLEETPEEYIQNMVNVFREVKRVLRDDGTLWLNIGDSYCATGTGTGTQASSTLQGGKGTQIEAGKRPDKSNLPGFKQKDLIGIPWMLAFALRADGWYLRQDIIWHKPNPMPESVTDRCTKAHEYIFLLSKSAKYYYNYEAIKQPLTISTLSRMNQDIENQSGSDRVPGETNGKMKAVVKGATFGGKKGREYTPLPGDPNFRNGNEQWGREYELSGDGKANKRSVWTVTTKPFKEAHFATFPEDLIVDCIKAGCPTDGLVIDPFMGAGTTAVVARKLNRNFIGIELNPDYIAIANKRLYNQIGLFL